jgi:hypothetical protein
VTEAGVVVVMCDRVSVARRRVLTLPAVSAVLVVLVCSPSIVAAAPAREAPLGWGPIPPGSTGGSETLARAVACPTTSQCTVVDTQGQQVTFNPTEPGYPLATTIDLDAALAGIACPSSSQCTAVDNQGQQVTFDPAEPAAASPTKLSFDSFGAVACPSSEECIGVGNPTTNAVMFNPAGPGLSYISGVDPTDGLGAVACPSSSQCTAVDLLGQEATFDPIAPDGGQVTIAIDALNWLDGLACPSTSQCTAVDYKGQQVTFDPTAAGDPVPTTIAPGDWLWDVACPSASQCTALGEGDEVTFNPTEAGSEKIAPIGINTFAGALACPSTSQCTAVGGSEEVTFDPLELPLAPEAPATPIVEPNRPGGSLRPSCTSLSGCLTDDLGSRLTFDGQLITLRALSSSVCVVPGGRLAVALDSAPIGRPRARLTFSSAAFYLDKGLARAPQAIESTAGARGQTATVTTYVANATVRRLPAIVRPLVAGLAPGAHTLTIKLYYEQRRVGHAGKLTITRVLTRKFSVC